LNNKTIGNDFESDFCKILSRNGFWAYNTINKAGGQPADIIAAKNNVPYLIDAKVCSKDEFKMERIEENQKNAMMLFDMCGNENKLFALKFSDESIYMCDGLTLIMLKQDRKTLSKSEVIEIGKSLDEWLEVVR